MDHNKINYDLIVALLEWIVGDEHEVINLYIHQYTEILFTSDKLLYKTFLDLKEHK